MISMASSQKSVAQRIIIVTDYNNMSTAERMGMLKEQEDRKRPHPAGVNRLLLIEPSCICLRVALTWMSYPSTSLVICLSDPELALACALGT